VRSSLRAASGVEGFVGSFMALSTHGNPVGTVNGATAVLQGHTMVNFNAWSSVAALARWVLLNKFTFGI
jgi:hypothetical protein